MDDLKVGVGGNCSSPGLKASVYILKSSTPSERGVIRDSEDVFSFNVGLEFYHTFPKGQSLALCRRVISFGRLEDARPVRYNAFNVYLCVLESLRPFSWHGYIVNALIRLRDETGYWLTVAKGLLESRIDFSSPEVADVYWLDLLEDSRKPLITRVRVESIRLTRHSVCSDWSLREYLFA